MPRRNRIHYRHAFHHVMLRGNNRQNIFHNANDYEDFIVCLSNAMHSYGALTHLYCLMTNHIHLVIEVTDIPISKIIQSVSTTYVKNHNKRYKKIGHLFQGRFKSKLIQDEQYLIELCYYIHMNPVKASMCESLDEYIWSSHHAYSINKNQDPQMLVSIDHIQGVLAKLGFSYHDFMQHYNRNNVRPVYCSFDQHGLVIKDSVISKSKPTNMLALENVPLHKIIDIVCDYLDVNPDDLSSGSQARKVTLARSMITYYSHYHAKYQLEDIASYFCLQRDSVSKTLHIHLRKAKSDMRINRMMEVLDSRLSMSDIDSWV